VPQISINSEGYTIFHNSKKILNGLNWGRFYDEGIESKATREWTTFPLSTGC